MKNEDLDQLMEIIGNAGNGALVAVIASLLAIMKAQPNFSPERFKEEIASLVQHPKTTEFQKKIWNCLIM